MAAQAFLRELAAQRPDLAPALGELADLHERRLWHELTLRLEEVVGAPAFCAPGDDVLVRLYGRFVSDFEAKLNQLKLAHVAVAVSARLAEPGAAAAFLSSCAAKLEGELGAAAPLLYLRVHVALLHLQAGDLGAAKAGVEAGRAALDALPSPDATVSASFHFVAAQLAKARQAFDDARLAELVFRYRARNFPEILTLEESARWEAHRAARLFEGEGGARTIDALSAEIDRLAESADERGEAILGALYDYAEMIAP